MSYFITCYNVSRDAILVEIMPLAQKMPLVIIDQKLTGDTVCLHPFTYDKANVCILPHVAYCVTRGLPEFVILTFDIYLWHSTSIAIVLVLTFIIQQYIIFITFLSLHKICTSISSGCDDSEEKMHIIAGCNLINRKLSTTTLPLNVYNICDMKMVSSVIRLRFVSVCVLILRIST